MVLPCFLRPSCRLEAAPLPRAPWSTPLHRRFRGTASFLPVIAILVGLFATMRPANAAEAVFCGFHNQELPTDFGALGVNIFSKVFKSFVGVDCQGGTPTPNAPAPTTTFTFTFNAPVANTTANLPIIVIDNPAGVPKALALVPGFNDNAPLIPCAPFSTCPTFTGLATGPGTSLIITYGKDSATSPTAGPSANQYSCLPGSHGNEVICSGTPVVPPGSVGSRTFRLSNLLLDTTGLPPGSPITASLTSSNSTVPIVGGTAVLGFVAGPTRTNAASLQFPFVSILKGVPPGSRTILQKTVFDADGHFAYVDTQNIDGVVSTVTGTGTYSVALTAAGQDVSMQLSGLDPAFSQQSLFLASDDDSFLASAPGGSGFGSRAPVEPTTAFDLAGFQLVKIDAARTNFVGKGSVTATDAATASINLEGIVSTPGHSSPVTGTGTISIGSDGSAIVRFPFFESEHPELSGPFQAEPTTDGLEGISLANEAITIGLEAFAAGH